ncbi:hypothetical protein OROGR_006580 [Orobanche gracilis]
MGFGKGLIFSLFLLMVMMILLFENNPCFSEGRGKFTRDKKVFYPLPPPHDVSNVVPNIHRNGYEGIAPDIDGNKVFDTEKRRVYAGPDPLHNR